ncbi:uncharacterized protein LOC122377662 [Amphibalanus amphitrite]|uniref:uncharacterized protein LOC122377662 n=1 Tax=Amphibalanus amphitrite TaxID=1232801 RepID=UPI001C90C5F0|nr:uncharacterized protein LOC122377662 [Amphibalanus amphitrite]XP_043213898.1 uncharacterized protein LOC122377662 [Amphibalanus amphitrite]XP_043213899.1 uncharacterized protein LOC122377662 [Amphibalanus amphitrite]XP_043213900.1 uncharacterized protein LOC122377662 [Amphibalanus amphitrite]
MEVEVEEDPVSTVDTVAIAEEEISTAMDSEEDGGEDGGEDGEDGELQEGTQVIHLDTVTLETSAGPSTPRKQKQYQQRYRHEWERLDFCRGWLTRHPVNKLLGYCKACDRSLHARRNDLRKHAASSKHRTNMSLLKQGLPRHQRVGKLNTVHPTKLNDPDLEGWCVAMPGQQHRVWCRQCQCSLIAQRKALKTHSKSRKHQLNAERAPQSPPPAGSTIVGDSSFNVVDTSLNESADCDSERAASPLIESDFSGRVTYSIGLGNRKVGFLGAGQIAQAIAQGMLEQGLLVPRDMMVGAPSNRNMTPWKRWKCRTTNDNDDVVREADIIFIAVKASVLVRLIGRLSPISDGKTRLFISLVPGVTRERMTALLSCRVLPLETVTGDPPADIEVTGPPLHVIRCAANKMMSISAGFCAYSMGDDVPHSLYLVVETMFSALGTCVQVEEHLMDAYSTMIASGAAFTCAFIEAMVQGGVSLDLGWDEALKVASAVVSGTSKLLLRTSVDPSALRKSISTPGGSTITGLAALQRGGLDDAVGKALQLACEKTRDVGNAVCGGGGGDTSTTSI